MTSTATQPSGLVSATPACEEKPSSAHCVDIGLAGDICLNNEFLCQRQSRPRNAIREFLWKPFSGCPVIVANLEAPVTAATTPYEIKAHLHRVSTAAIELLDQRIVLSLANNHIMDYGETGLADTLAALDNAGIAHAGAGLDLGQARRPYKLTVQDTAVAVICAADPRFNAAGESRAGVCPAHRDLLVESIDTLVEENRMIVVSLHMGLEHVSVPSRRQIALAEACLSRGAHIVHFHHAHRVKGVALGWQGLVLFGMGNYVATKSSPVKALSARRTAACLVRLDPAARRVSSFTWKPALLDDSGLPHPLGPEAAKRELRRIDHASRNAVNNRRRLFRLFMDMLTPEFLRTNACNYWFLLRKRGFLFVLESLAAGVRTHLSTRRNEPDTR